MHDYCCTHPSLRDVITDMEAIARTIMTQLDTGSSQPRRLSRPLGIVAVRTSVQ